MTDKQLEEYTRLKIAEETKKLTKEISNLKEKVDELDSGCFKYKSDSCGYRYSNINYFSEDDLTTELKEKVQEIKELSPKIKELEANNELIKERLILYVDKAEEFYKDTLFNRLKKAFEGHL